MVEEHEAKAREDQGNHEYDLEMLQNELTAVTEEHKQYVSHYENELNLRHQ